MGRVGRVPFNFGEPGHQAYLVPTNFCDGHFCWARRITLEALNFLLTHREKLLDLNFKVDGIDAERVKSVNATAGGGQITQTSIRLGLSPQNTCPGFYI